MLHFKPFITSRALSCFYNYHVSQLFLENSPPYLIFHLVHVHRLLIIFQISSIWHSEIVRRNFRNGSVFLECLSFSGPQSELRSVKLAVSSGLNPKNIATTSISFDNFKILAKEQKLMWRQNNMLCYLKNRQSISATQPGWFGSQLTQLQNKRISYLYHSITKSSNSSTMIYN